MQTAERAVRVVSYTGQAAEVTFNGSTSGDEFLRWAVTRVGLETDAGQTYAGITRSRLVIAPTTEPVADRIAELDEVTLVPEFQSAGEVARS